MESKNLGMRLLKKGQSGIRLLMGRMGLVILILLANIMGVAAIFVWFEKYVAHYLGGTAVIGVLMVFYLINRSMEPTIRTAWIVVVMASPVFGSLFYWFTRLELGQRLLTKVSRRNMRHNPLPTDNEALDQLKAEDMGAYRMCDYVCRKGNTSLFDATNTTYIPQGEEKLRIVLDELEKAENFIYLEYFIISEGQMWGQILEVLARKAQQGVDVRVLYDGACEFILLPRNYPKRLADLGIQCKVFSPFRIFVSTHYNYRDHRKILVIDGHTAFNGGINLSDEYINIGSPCGHWKDTAVMVKGPAAQGFTHLFLQMWNMSEAKPDIAALQVPFVRTEGTGIVMPFGDNPMDDVALGHRVYSDILNRATDRVRIMTPYLILDSGMEATLCYAAERGVRVQLILPGIPDKYVPYAIAKTHYRQLLDAGVEIYEYIPGFVHGKVVTADGREAVVGTINFDYRSFFHHFECATYLFKADCISDIEMDFDTCLSQCRKVSRDTLAREPWHRKLIGYLLKVFSPLL